MWNNWLILWQISIHNCEGGERSPSPLKLLLLQQPTVTWPHDLPRSRPVGTSSFNREEGRRYPWKVRKSTEDVMIQQNWTHRFACLEQDSVLYSVTICTANSIWAGGDGPSFVIYWLTWYIAFFFYFFNPYEVENYLKINKGKTDPFLFVLQSLQFTASDGRKESMK